MNDGTVRNPILVLILPMVTFGIYGLYWFYVTMQELNAGLGEDRFSPVRDLILMMVTCGIWALYISWKMAESIVELEKLRGVDPKFEPVIIFITAFFGLYPLLAQLSLNNAWEATGDAASY